jgi:hypothetical protein
MRNRLRKVLNSESWRHLKGNLGSMGGPLEDLRCIIHVSTPTQGATGNVVSAEIPVLSKPIHCIAQTLLNRPRIKSQ